MDQKNAMEPGSRGSSLWGRIASAMRRLKSDTRGNTLTIFAMSVVPIVGCVGIGLDMAQWVLWKRQLHTAADMAALAGASASSQGHQVKSAVETSLDKNKLRDFNIVAIETPPSVGSYAGDSSAVRVLLQTQQVLPFSSIFLPTPPVIDAEATAISVSETQNCIISLANSGNGIVMQGSSSIDMSCGMSSNANLDAYSSDLMSTSALSAAGSILSNGNIDPETKINNGIQPLADPLASTIPEPDTSLCGGASAYTIRSKKIGSITPGCYTSITASGTVNMAPGVYIIDGGDVTVGSAGALIGEGVTIVMTSSLDCTGSCIGRFVSQGTSLVDLSAPTSGPYAGIVYYQDARAGVENTTINYFRGTTGTDNAGNTITTSFQGTIYAPGSRTVFTGNSSISTPCMQVIGWQVWFEGNTTIENNCPPGSGASSYGGQRILRLVE